MACQWEVPESSPLLTKFEKKSGDAHPIFLRALRESVDGYFHPLNDVAALANEMVSLELNFFKKNKKFKSNCKNSLQKQPCHWVEKNLY